MLRRWLGQLVGLTTRRSILWIGPKRPQEVCSVAFSCRLGHLALRCMPARRLVMVLPVIVGMAVIVSHLAGLQASPPGLFGDEAAFGYNGWAISHYGVDQYGVPWPLFFRSFGDYKGPVGVYSVALLTAFLPLTPFTVRLPNALAGIALSMVAGG